VYSFPQSSRCFDKHGLAFSPVFVVLLTFLFWSSIVFRSMADVPGTIVSWGYNPGGGLPQPAGLTNVVKLSLRYHFLAVRADGTVVGWGDNSSGQATVPAGLTNVTAVSAGRSHSLALRANGTVAQWGYPFMPPVPAGLNDVRAIAAGSFFSLAVRSNGTVVGWASGPNPGTNIPPTLTNAIAVAAGQNFAVALTSAGKVVAWGVNDSSQTNVPASATNVVAVDAGDYYAQALRADGSIVAWGFKIPGANAPPPLSDVAAMGMFRAVRSNGTVVVWGPDPNYDNQPPIGLSNVVAVATGEGRHHALVQVDDTHLPSVVPRPLWVNEGNVLNSQSVEVVLTVPTPKQVSVDYATVEGTAIEGEDFVGVHGRLIFPPNVATQTISLTVIGDVVKETQEETLSLQLSAPSNAVLAGNPAGITINDDDTLVVPSGFGATSVATNINFATALEFSPDGRLFVCEQAGRVRIIKNGVLLAQPFLDLPVVTEDYAEAGLLGIAFDPDFPSSPFVYVYYTTTVPNTNLRRNRISRFDVQGDVALTNTEFVVIDLDPVTSAAIHNGGAIHFGPDGKLYAAVGDNGTGTNSQSFNNLLGKVLRVNRDGSIPSDNPFFLTAIGQNRAIWALGLRNPFSFTFNPATGRPLINDVGNATWEEIDDGRAGTNYGWPLIEGPSANPAYLSPVFAYNHSNGCAIVGSAFYAPAVANFPSNFVGNYLFGDYCNGWLRRLTNGTGAADFLTGLNYLVDIKVGPDGALYVLRRVTSLNGTVYRISWKDPVRIKSIARTSNGPAQLTATARPNHAYILEASTNLGQWLAIQTNSAASNTINFADPAATNFTRRFYRVGE
jgi:glucose/arabinose dehydrogenase